MSYSFLTFAIVLAVIVLGYILWYGIFQWCYWIENGHLWQSKSYKQWVIERRRRVFWSCAVLAVLISVIMGFIGGIQ